MAKKNFENLGKTRNLGGGGLATIIGDSAAKMEPKTEEEQDGEKVRTYSYKLSDLAFLKRYTQVMSYRSGDDYPIKRAIADAIALLKAKHPEIEEK